MPSLNSPSFLIFQPMNSTRSKVFLALLTLFVASASQVNDRVHAEEAEARIKAGLEYLASDELEGRGIGTKGLEQAADFVAEQFAEIGLETKVFEGSPFQVFEMTTSAKLGSKKENQLTIHSTSKSSDKDSAKTVKLEIGQDYTPLSAGGSNQFDLPIVFVGYGITAKEHEYDDYAGIDVEGKIVLILRKEPQQNNPHSLFDGTDSSRHALFSRKISNAFQHGAAGVIMINDQQELVTKRKNHTRSWNTALKDLPALQAEYKKLESPTEKETTEFRKKTTQLAKKIAEHGEKLTGEIDEIIPFSGAGESNSHPKMPVFFALRSIFEPLVAATFKKPLNEIEDAIDKNFKPASGLLKGVTAVGEAKINRLKASVKNVVALLSPKSGNTEEVVIVGAHYDHLGKGGPGSLAPWTKEIHNGADDNASGVMALLEVARQLKAKQGELKRTIVFIAFTAEERGLIGSSYYSKHPIFPMKNTVAMINMDMVGRLNENKLIIHGTGTAKEMEAIVDQATKGSEFKITKDPGGFGPSDHATFYANKIPVLHFFTGTHTDYHRPSDDAQKVNYPGIVRIVDTISAAVLAVNVTEKRLEYVSVESKAPQRPSGSRPYFGSIPDFSQVGEGYALQGVSKNSPSEKAGLKAGDVIIKLGDSKIASLADFDGALRQYKAGEKVKVTVRRDNREITLTVTLDPPR
ncbi:MAG: aminopeptidase [Blastopirellula sp.]|nr:MAG: aminopeptidase [Blastopirellula sp.]